MIKESEMSELDPNALSLISSAASAVPEPVKASFFKAISDLLGGLASVPAAKLKQYTQAIDDTTAARSTVAGVLAKAAADEAGADPQLLKIAAEIYLPTTVRKVKNRLSVARSAAEHLATTAPVENDDETSAPDNDWMNSFMRFAEDASSERMQDLFGRILAGQVLRPGAFGLATLRAMSELDQSIANDFTTAWAKSVGDAVDYSPDWQRGDGYSRWKRLAEAGLMAPNPSTQFLPPFKATSNGLAVWSPMWKDGTGLRVYFQEGSSSTWQQIDFTRVGKELGSILEKPDYEKNMRWAAHRLPQSGLKQIDLIKPDTPSETIWKSQP
jgi:hypothetical protein